MMEFFLAQAVPSSDPNSIGLSITALIGSLGATGAAVAVTYYFLGFLKNKTDQDSKLLSEFRDYHAESQKKFQDQIERLNDRQEAAQRTLMEHMARASDGQNSLMRDVIIATKSLEKTVDQSSGQVQAIQKTVDSLQMAVGALDTLVKSSVGFWPPTTVRAIGPTRPEDPR